MEWHPVIGHPAKGHDERKWPFFSVQVLMEIMWRSLLMVLEVGNEDILPYNGDRRTMGNSIRFDGFPVVGKWKGMGEQR